MIIGRQILTGLHVLGDRSETRRSSSFLVTAGYQLTSSRQLAYNVIISRRYEYTRGCNLRFVMQSKRVAIHQDKRNPSEDPSMVIGDGAFRSWAFNSDPRIYLGKVIFFSHKDKCLFSTHLARSLVVSKRFYRY